MQLEQKTWGSQVSSWGFYFIRRKSPHSSRIKKAMVSSMLGVFRFRSARSLERAHPWKVKIPWITNNTFQRHETRVGNNIYPYDLTQGEYAVLTNGVSHSISNSNGHSGQSTDTGLGYQHNENMGISYDHVLQVLEAPKSSKFWCKRTSSGPQCTICGQKCSREDNLKRHVRSRVCEKEWNRKTWIEQWIILEGMAVNA